MTRKKFISNSRLTSKEIMKIAQVAKESNYLESYIKWCQTALEVAKMENCDEKFTNSIQQDIKVLSKCLSKIVFMQDLTLISVGSFVHLQRGHVSK